MSIRLRPAVPGDAAAIAAIYAPYVRDTCVTFETEPPTAEEYRERIERIRGFFPFLVLEEDGQAVGYAYAHLFHERRAFGWLCETTIYVRQDRRRRGYARRLYRSLLCALRLQGFCDAIAVLGCPNLPSERLHESLGFALAMRYDGAGYKLGGWHDVEYYVLHLNPRTDSPREPVPFSQIEPKWKQMEGEPALSE